MWIKWLYCDHGFGDFKELEIPDDLDGEASVPEYLCTRQDLGIPTWGERFMMGRIKWEKLNLPPEELQAREVKNLQSSIAYHKSQLKQAKDRLAAITNAKRRPTKDHRDQPAGGSRRH